MSTDRDLWNNSKFTHRFLLKKFNVLTPGFLKLLMSTHQNLAEGGKKFSFVGENFKREKIFLAQRGRSEKKNVGRNSTSM